MVFVKSPGIEGRLIWSVGQSCISVSALPNDRCSNSLAAISLLVAIIRLTKVPTPARSLSISLGSQCAGSGGCGQEASTQYALDYHCGRTRRRDINPTFRSLMRMQEKYLPASIWTVLQRGQSLNLPLSAKRQHHAVGHTQRLHYASGFDSSRPNTTRRLFGRLRVRWIPNSPPIWRP